MTERWTYSAGERPNTVTVYEHSPGGVIWARVWNQKARGGKGNWTRESLGHRDKKWARHYAKDEAAKLQLGKDAEPEEVTLAHVCTEYERHCTPDKCESEQQADKRRSELWCRFLDGASDPHDVSQSQWKSFTNARSSGAIDARGNAIRKDKRKAVRARTVEADCIWLNIVFNWAKDWSLGDKRYLMRENPVRGYVMPHEDNPLRPVASEDRYEAIRAISDAHTMEVRRDGKREQRRSYLSELLDIVNGTGRRISAVCQLRYDDLLFTDDRLRSRLAALGMEEGLTDRYGNLRYPFGAIHWPASTDKRKRDWVVAIDPETRAAVDRILRERPGIGSLPLFPSGIDGEKPISRHLADAWLRETEAVAKLPPQRGSLWHAYRRKWATERKHHPDADVMAVGGWKSLDALKASYQHADPDTSLEVVLGGGKLRVAK